MSRMYYNESLKSIPVSNHDWSEPWNEDQYHSGKGFLLEGVLKAKTRHVICDTNQAKYRFYVLYIQVSIAHRRQYSIKGEEIEPNFSANMVKNTGYLNSSYKLEAKGQTDMVEFSEVLKAIKKSPLASITDTLTPKGCGAFWILEADMNKMEVDIDEKIRLKTNGDSPFVFSITKLDTISSKVCNYAGGSEVGASWTDKVFASKEQDAPTDSSNQDNAGADDDEWDD
ncbi:arpin-like [Anneissia japonica]|uniref:arpin-like n=1 Tax=Anneissia japonica TaxID=1529436 RepID=UPI00142588F6|nr:arpin-like [Anneissia japonica]